MAVLVGKQAPDFTATAVYGNNEIKDLKLSDFKGKPVVLFFYPLDFTFVCPTELEDLANQYADLQAMNVEVYAVSTDTHFSHKSWHDSSPAISKINFHMLGDQNHTITKNFDVLREGVGLADQAGRLDRQKIRVARAGADDNNVELV